MTLLKMESHTFIEQPICSEALIIFKHSVFNLLFLPSTFTRATQEVELMHRDAALIGDKELYLALWTLSSFVATVSGLIGYISAQVSCQENFMIGTEPRVQEPGNQIHWDLVGWLRNPFSPSGKAL